MTFVLGNRVWETTTATGTSDLSLDGAKDSNFDTFFGGVGFGNTTHYFLIWGSGWEYGVGTVASGPTLQRTTILGNSNHDTAKVSLPDGEKDVYCAAITGSAFLLDQNQARAATFSMAGFPLVMDNIASPGASPIGTTSLIGDAQNRVSFFIAGESVWRVHGNDVVWTQLRSSFSGANGHPFHEFYRDIGPSANYSLGEIIFSAQDNASNYNIYASIKAVCVDPTDGSEDGRVVHSVQVTGTMLEIMRVDGDAVWVKGNASGFGGQGLIVTGGGSPKTAFQQYGNVGFEAYNDGRTGITANGQTPLVVNRGTNDGQIISIRAQGVEQGSISISGASTTYGTFTGVHWSDWAEGERPDSEEIGTVVISSEEIFMPEKEHLPRVALTTMQGDTAVYGVIVGRELVQGGSRLLVAGLGTFRVRVQGSVKRGDLLETSATPGVAQAQTGNVVRSSTIGKVTKSDPSPDVRLVNVTLCCG